MKISVIMPVYNSSKHLDKCISSVINQTFTDWELIMIDDGSTDKSLEILEKYRTNNKKLRIVSGVNCGCGGALNKGLNLAEGEFIAFVDGDDYMMPTMLQTLYENMITSDSDIVRCSSSSLFLGKIIGPALNDCTCSYKNKTEIYPKEDKSFVFNETACYWNKLYKRELFDNIRFPERTNWEDLAVIRPVLAASNKILYLRNKEYMYRANFSGVTAEGFKTPTEKVLDIFKVCDLMADNFKKMGTYDYFKEEILTHQIFSCMLRVQNAGLWFKLKTQDRIELTNILVNLIEIKYGDWLENPSYVAFKKSNIISGMSMDYIEMDLLDESLRKETSEKFLEQKVLHLFNKQTY